LSIINNQLLFVSGDAKAGGIMYARWKSESALGIEHLDLEVGAEGIEVTSVVVGDRFGPYGAWYRLRCAADWSVRSVEINVVGGASIRLAADGAGNWYDAGGAAIPDFRGCVDVDISATPFTNTLPIRRLGLANGERREISVLYIPVPALTPSVAAQAYTRLGEGQLYRYEGLFRGFEAKLEIDSNGLVVDYPSLFQRIS
jgi:uncharacterized protein